MRGGSRPRERETRNQNKLENQAIVVERNQYSSWKISNSVRRRCGVKSTDKYYLYSSDSAFSRTLFCPLVILTIDLIPAITSFRTLMANLSDWMIVSHKYQNAAQRISRATPCPRFKFNWDQPGFWRLSMVWHPTPTAPTPWVALRIVLALDNHDRLSNVWSSLCVSFPRSPARCSAAWKIHVVFSANAICTNHGIVSPCFKLNFSVILKGLRNMPFRIR